MVFCPPPWYFRYLWAQSSVGYIEKQIAQVTESSRMGPNRQTKVSAIRQHHAGNNLRSLLFNKMSAKLYGTKTGSSVRRRERCDRRERACRLDWLVTGAQVFNIELRHENRRQKVNSHFVCRPWRWPAWEITSPKLVATTLPPIDT